MKELQRKPKTKGNKRANVIFLFHYKFEEFAKFFTEARKARLSRIWIVNFQLLPVSKALNGSLAFGVCKNDYPDFIDYFWNSRLVSYLVSNQ